MTDRISLIARIGARIQACLDAGDVETADVLRDSLTQLVADAALEADIEGRRAKDRRRKKDVAEIPRIPRKDGNSTDSAESVESDPTRDVADAAHITRALGLEVQEQDQKQKLESSLELSPRVAVAPTGDDDGETDPAPGHDPPASRFSLVPDPPSPPFDPATRWGIGDAGLLTPPKVRRAVDFVAEHYIARHPRRRPGTKERKLIERHLRTYTPRELCDAIDGNADDEWAKGIGKHELAWTLRDNGKIDDYREKAERANAGAERDAGQIESTGWFPSEAMR